jgi:hypothetical protein
MRQRTKLVILASLACLLGALAVRASDPATRPPDAEPPPSLPDWAQERLLDPDFRRDYAVSTHLEPAALSGDFDGDGRTDVAVLVARRATGARGIAFLHAGSPHAWVVGAGHELGNGGDDFSWMDAWSVQPRGRVAGQRGEAVLVEQREAASALLYWDGAAWRWHQQGD